MGAVQAEYEDALGPEGAQGMSDDPGVPIGEKRRAKREDAAARLRARGLHASSAARSI